jgi:hypothetical protein
MMMPKANHCDQSGSHNTPRANGAIPNGNMAFSIPTRLV